MVADISPHAVVLLSSGKSPAELFSLSDYRHLVNVGALLSLSLFPQSALSTHCWFWGFPLLRLPALVSESIEAMYSHS